MNTELPFSIFTLELGQMDNLVYLIHDHDSNRAAVIDPAWDVSKVLETVEKKGCCVTDILLTHSHYDHTNGLSELLRNCNAQVHLHKEEAEFWGQQLEKPILHNDKNKIHLGQVEIEIWHTPGHTPGSVCYYFGGYLLTGDTLFVYGCGRCDLSGGNSEQMYHSLKRLATELPPQTIILPGHDYGNTLTSTLGEQINGNPFMHFENSEDFTHYRTYGHDRVMPYTSVIR